MRHLGLLLTALCGACSSPERVADPIADAAPTLEVGEGSVRSLDEVPLRYEVEGSGDTALVFVHGWSGNRGFWREQLDAFSGEYRVVALDLAGHGDSGDARRAWTVDAFAGDIRAVIEHLQLTRVVLIGHSTSAAACLLVAKDLRWRVAGVVGIDALHDVNQPWDEVQLGATIAELGRDHEGFYTRFVHAQCAADADPALVERITNEMAATPPGIAARALRAFTRVDVRAALAACPVPVYCINPSALARTKVAANRHVKPTFEAVVLDHVGHFVMIEQPAAFDAELRKALAALETLNPRR